MLIFFFIQPKFWFSVWPFLNMVLCHNSHFLWIFLRTAHGKCLQNGTLTTHKHSHAHTQHAAHTHTLGDYKLAEQRQRRRLPPISICLFRFSTWSLLLLLCSEDVARICCCQDAFSGLFTEPSFLWAAVALESQIHTEPEFRTRFWSSDAGSAALVLCCCGQGLSLRRNHRPNSLRPVKRAGGTEERASSGERKPVVD